MAHIKCFVINLPRSIERLHACSNRLQQLGIDYEIFTATDGFNLTAQDLELCKIETTSVLPLNKQRQIMMKNPLSPCEVGCALSHLRLYQHILQQHLPYACILEDDCLVKPAFKTALNSISQLDLSWDLINFAQNSSLRSWPWQHKVYLSADKTQYIQKVGLDFPYLNALFNSRRLIYGTFLYLISAHACRRLLEIGYPVRFPSDILTGHIAFNRLAIWQVHPKASFYASFNDFETLIANRPNHDLQVM